MNYLRKLVIKYFFVYSSWMHFFTKFSNFHHEIRKINSSIDEHLHSVVFPFTSDVRFFFHFGNWNLPLKFSSTKYQNQLYPHHKTLQKENLMKNAEICCKKYCCWHKQIKSNFAQGFLDDWKGEDKKKEK